MVCCGGVSDGGVWYFFCLRLVNSVGLLVVVCVSWLMIWMSGCSAGGLFCWLLWLCLLFVRCVA